MKIRITILKFSNFLKQSRSMFSMLTALALVTAIFGVTGCSPPHPH